jgi:unsaturated rhamnogalacturonyl hydrolase
MQKLYELCGEEKYLLYSKDWVDSIIDDKGEIHTFDPGQLDDLQPGILLFPLYEKYSEEQYRKALNTLLSKIWNFPRNRDGGFWHNEKYREQMWLDGLYMGGPISARYGAVFSHPEFFDLCIEQALLMEAKTKDEKTGLFYHAWDSLKKAAWADPVTGRSPEFWGRSIGWVPVALLEELDFIPPLYPKRGELARIVKELLQAVIRYQDEESGLWYQVVNKGGQWGNWLESSCTCLFAAAICKAVRTGILDESYLACAEKAYRGIVQRLRSDENGGLVIGGICIGTGVGDYTHYCKRPTAENDLHGVGAFVLMCDEVARIRTNQADVS